MKIGKGMKMRTTSLISFIVFLTIAGHALADVDWCDVEIVPEYPTSQDAVVITLFGVWGNSCIPDDSGVSLVGNNIYFDVIWTYPPVGCLFVLTPWERTESVGPLSPGTYTVYARMVGYSGVTPYELVAEFLVMDYQFVLSTESITVPEGAAATFTVSLLMEPSGTVEATVARQSGDADITVQSGGTLIFETWNYSIPQTVTLAADEDEDYLDGTAVITVSAPNYLSCEVAATEADNDTPHVLYVDINADGNNNGKNWSDAYTDLHDALSVAAAYPEVEEIRVAQGIYTPAEPNGDRGISFNLDSITIRGGFAGCSHSEPNNRNVNLYRTILSGDLNGDDDSKFANNGENSQRVMNCDGTVALDGLTISGGNGGSGAGLYTMPRCQLTAMNCVFSNNFASYGGGMYNNSGNITLINCLFIGNCATSEGGGIYSNPCNLTLINCTVSNNSGGGMDGNIWYTNVTLTNCIFSSNGGTSESEQIGEGVFTIIYSCIQGWTGNLGGIGNIDVDPCFVDADNGDYHLKSQEGRWDPNSESWVKDDVTSPCIDAGNPGCPVGEEPAPNGNRKNMGAYGGTIEASKSPTYWRSIADITNDWIVDSNDLKVFVGYWLQMGRCIPGDFDRSQFVDFNDFAILGGQWRQKGPGPGISYQVGSCIPVDFPLSAVVEFEPTRFTVTVEGQYILFEDMMRANCCPEELDVQMTVEGDLITIYEIERFFTRVPCPCLCDYPITATFGPFEPDIYILAVYQNSSLIGSTTVTIENGQ